MLRVLLDHKVLKAIRADKVHKADKVLLVLKVHKVAKDPLV